MHVKITPSFLSGHIDILPSKSYFHRILICCALCKEETLILRHSDSDDITHTILSLRSIGAKIEDTKEGFLVRPANKSIFDSVLNVGESGSTLRFMVPLVSALGLGGQFITKSGLAKRPMLELLEVLVEHSIDIVSEFPLKISGKLTPGVYNIRGDISSQFITGLLLALPLLDGDSEIFIKGTTQSQSYIDITLEILKIFGIIIKKTSSGYAVLGNQQYKSPKTISVEGDWSNAAFWLVAAAINGDLYVGGLNYKSTQGDKQIIDILKCANGNISISDNLVHAYKSELKAFSCDAADCPDLVPILSILASCANGQSVIKNVDRLRFKECDRIEATISNLKKLGIKAVYDGELKITGGIPNSGKLEGFNDHRMVMSAVVLGLLTEVEITGAEAHRKSYPDFFSVFKKVGGLCDTIE
ncbi:MAG: 3-phosphoshikimate 1-carboxyvinyltransferase [Christensenellaceae bacterium]|jgi:3-phosphoshikimate 1-carboxyvinyltransferase|nr:3-phosphoshikimate 1-carboxyvinyltransferase [Christensenellaceae bacterium]